jgi:hypothetical protein
VGLRCRGKGVNRTILDRLVSSFFALKRAILIKPPRGTRRQYIVVAGSIATGAAGLLAKTGKGLDRVDNGFGGAYTP